jgi:superfamily II DNA or RNA helicase
MNSLSQWRTGDRVVARGERWDVLDETPFADCAALRLLGAAPGNFGRVRTLLTPFDRPRAVPRRTSWHAVRPRRWLHAVRRAALDQHPQGGLRAAAAARIDLLPYQLEPALAIWRHGATRVLIADDVGLGKTIEAGLILNECAARCDGVRALILTPAGVRDQWAHELDRLFDLPSTKADAAWLRSAARELPADVNPWALPGIFISSFDFVKRPEVLRPLEDVTWDLVVADEVHGATLTTNRHAAVDAAASRARRVVLLTATPYAGDAGQFESICRVGAVNASVPIVMFRRVRGEVSRTAARRTSMLAVRTSGDERRMHRLLERYTDALCREALARSDARARLAAIVLRKRALSSAGSLAASARRRIQLLAGAASSPERQLTLPIFDEDPLPDAAPDQSLAAPGLADAARERRWLSAIAHAADTAARAETKTAFLLRLLRRVSEPAIVFTEYRDTLTRLQSALAQPGRVALVLHGGMTPAERTTVQRQFNQTPSLLLATDAASEGLNLHTHCRIVIHYELPWSPARLQQRTGRVDRIGQRRTVHEILMVAGDTAERVVLGPLLKRAARAGALEKGRGLAEAIAESRVAALVMGGETIDAAVEGAREHTALTCTVRPDLRGEAAAEAARLELLRRWSAASARTTRNAREDDGLLATVLRRPHDVPAALMTGTLLYRLSIAAADGTLVHSELVPVEFDARGSAQPLDRARQIRAAAARIADLYDPVARRLMKSRFVGVVDLTIARHTAAIEALGQREEAIAGGAPAAARQLVQPGLFDRRAVRLAASRQRVSAALRESANGRLALLRTRQCVSVSIELSGLLLRPSRRLLA